MTKRLRDWRANRSTTRPARSSFTATSTYIALGEVVHRVSGLPLDEFARRNIFEPLGMHDTSFRPNLKLRARIAPTEQRRDSSVISATNRKVQRLMRTNGCAAKS